MNWIIITAGGNGKRMGLSENKIFAKIGKRPLLYWTLKVFEESPIIDQIIMSARSEDIEKIKEILRKFLVKKVKHIVPAQETRQKSTYYILKTLQNVISRRDLVGVHNAVNPFVTKKEIENVFKACKNGVAALLAQPAIDTIKITDSQKFVHETPLREYCWCAQTPQVARFKALFDAHTKADQERFSGTDDTQLLERIGIKAVIIPCSRLNFKITYGEDLFRARENLKFFLENNV